VLEQLANAQKIDTLRAKYLWAGALLLRDHLDDHGTAKSWLKRMLEADPLDQRGFDAYTEGLERDRSWNDLSKAIRNHLKALPKDTPPERLAGLFERLGEAHEKLQDTKTAIAAYDQAARLGSRGSDRDATQIGRRMRVMKLGVGLGGDELEKAVHHGHAVIAANPMDFEVYHRLVEIYLKQGNRDRARAVARTLKFLKQADEGELELVGSGEALGQVRSSLSRDNWRREVYHPAEDPRLSDLFMIVWPMVAAREGRTHDHFGVERSHRTAVSLQSPQALARFVAHACQTLDAPVPDLFVLEDEAGGIHIDALAHGTDSKNTVYPTVIAGKDALKDVSETAMKFRAGRAVARVRPDHILSAVLRSSTSMRHVVYGALRLTDGDAEIPEDSRSASAAYAETFAPYLQPARLEQLRSLAAAVTSNGEVDTRAWARGVIFTTTRAGFISCDSLDVAAQILTREGDEGSLISAKERIADLIAYSVSEPYLKLRKAVGLSR
jgi:DNA-binding SARP family transcriptional activator